MKPAAGREDLGRRIFIPGMGWYPLELDGSLELHGVGFGVRQLRPGEQNQEGSSDR